MSYTQYPFTVKNKQSYAFGTIILFNHFYIGGKTNIRSTGDHGHSFNGVPILTNPSEYSGANQLAQTKDTLSQTQRSAYVGRSKLNKAKSTASSHRAGSQRPESNGMKVYYPVEYYQHAGYTINDAQSQVNDKKSIVTKARFNEELHTAKKETASQYSRPMTAKTQSLVGEKQRAQSSYVKKRIIDKINDANEQVMDSMSQNMNLEEGDDKESVIT